MQTIKNIQAVFFSPTGNTKYVVEQLAAILSQKLGVPLHKDDFTLPAARTNARIYRAQDLVIFGVPTYAGRVPNKVLPFVQNLFQGNSTFAVVVATFGNRSFDNSLSELDSELKKNNFSVLGAGAVVCHHAFANVGDGRPNASDQAQLASFADAVFEKLQAASIPLPDVPIKRNEALTAYYVPLGLDGKPVNFLKAKPITDKALCDNCGVCAAVCPMAAIDKNDVSLVPGLCIKCQACITHCHTKAKSFDDPLFLSHKAMLEQNYTRAAVSEFFV
ncbi:MAG: EFR1 family ferrodoxin [Treponema sp.]